jgi:hypothetical protein
MILLKSLFSEMHALEQDAFIRNDKVKMAEVWYTDM